VAAASDSVRYLKHQDPDGKYPVRVRLRPVRGRDGLDAIVDVSTAPDDAIARDNESGWTEL